MKLRIVPFTLVIGTFLIGSCNSDSGTGATFTIGGTASGQTGSFTLQNNSGDTLTINTNDTSFQFATQVTGLAGYSVTVATNPSGQTCQVSSGTGTPTSDVTTVSVTCTTSDSGGGVSSYSIGGSVSGLANNATVTLQNNAGDNKIVSANGVFSFTTQLGAASSYSVTASSQPTNQNCTVTSGTGTVSAANITGVSVVCTTTLPRIWASQATDGNLAAIGGAANGIAGADYFCMHDSGKPATGTYKAMLVDSIHRIACTTAYCGGGSSEHTDWVLAPNTTYYRTNLSTVTITTNAAGIATVDLTTSISIGIAYAWTGMQTNWTTDSSNDCTNWTTTTGNGNAGKISRTSIDDVISYSNYACTDNSRLLICVEQ